MRAVFAALKLLAFAGLTLPFALWQALVRRFRPGAVRGFPPLYPRLACRILGVKLVVDGTPPVNGPALMVANHVSWLDIPILSATAALSFVAKREVGSWPLFGPLSRLQGTVYVNRERRQTTGTSRNELHERLAAGSIMVLFPEGTSSDGTGLLPFKSSFFAAALRDDVPVIPVTLAYERVHGLPMTRRERPLFAWYGDMELAPHLWNALKAGPLTVRVRFHGALSPHDFAGRKALSQTVEDLLRNDLALCLAGRA